MLMHSLWLILFFVSALQASPSEQWQFVKVKDLGTLPGGAALKKVTLREGSHQEQEAIITAVLFSEKKNELHVIDNSMRDKTLAQVMQEQHFLAGVNGGYFRPDGRPMGFVMSQGKVIHAQETAPRLLTGFVVVAGEKSQLLHVGEKIPEGATEILQTGPFLINHGVPVIGLETTRIARRTFIATDKDGLWMIGVISPVTLADAARVLLAAAPHFFSKHSIQRALNLDGGSSSALWADLSAEPFAQSEIGYVNNFLGIKIRKF